VPADPTDPQPTDPQPTDPSDAPPAGRDAGDNWSAASIQDEILRQSLDAIIVTDSELRVRIWNPAAVELYGIAADEAIGQRLRDLVDTLDTARRPLDTASAREDLETSGGWRARVTQRPRIGSHVGREVVIDSLVTLLRGPDGRPAGALGVNRDVTSTARVEAEMAALGSLVDATGRARTKAEVAQAAIDILVRATGADAGLVTSTDGTYEAIARLGVRQETIDIIVNYGQLGGPLARALQAADSYISADVATAPLREDVRAAVLADGIEHLIVVGLRLSDRLTGILALGWHKTSPSEPSRPIVHQAAALIASSIENARLLAAVEAGLEQERVLSRRMRALVELTRLPATVASDRGVDRLMQEVSAVILADASMYAAFDGERLHLGPVDRVDTSDAEPLVNRPAGEVPFLRSLLAGAPALLFPLSEPWASAAGVISGTSRGFHSVAAFAVRDAEVLVGVVLALFRRPVDELEIDERTLESIGRVLDISFANRRLRQGLLASEQRYRDLFQASPEALLVESHDTVIDANWAARNLFGDDVIGHPIRDLYIGDYDDIDRDALGPTGIGRFVGLGRRLDGSTFPEEVDVRPIEIAGEPRMLTIVRDLTERSKLQAELIQAQKMEAIGLLVAGVAHELNNPLASIVGFSHLIRTDPNLPADLRSQADLLVQEANRTRVIVQNLLDFARQRPPERVEMELRPLLDSVLGLQTFVLARSRMTVEVDLEPDLPRISVDRSQIQQVLINLTVNATQAIRSDNRPGTIRIQARSVRDELGPVAVRIEVADDGPGVPAAIVDRLFMPFVTSKEPGEGTGLGLSVSFGIVASHGGTLRHERNESGGATFIIELPVGPDATGSAGELARDGQEIAVSSVPEAIAATGTATGATGATQGEAEPTPHAAAQDASRADDSPLRILVLDDEPSIRDFLGRVLKRNGHDPILAASGAIALEIVRSAPPDAILCDHRMAGMSGTEFHDAVMEVAPELVGRFAFMSGDVLNPELLAFASARRIHLLAKPFDMAAVSDIVATLVAGVPA